MRCVGNSSVDLSGLMDSRVALLRFFGNRPSKKERTDCCGLLAGLSHRLEVGALLASESLDRLEVEEEFGITTSIGCVVRFKLSQRLRFYHKMKIGHKHYRVVLLTISVMLAKR